MHKPWPDGAEAVALSVQDLALRILDRLDVTPDDPFHSLFSRRSFVERVVTEYETGLRRIPGQMTVTHSDTALARHPELAKAYGEAWDYAVRQGWLADDPSRRGFVYVTRAGEDALEDYRDDADVEAAAEDAATAGNVNGSVASDGRKTIPWFGRLFNETWKRIVAPVLVILIAGVITYAARGCVSDDTSDEGAAFTVQNDVSHGAWVVSSPTVSRLYPRTTRPPNALRWIPDGIVITLTCASIGTPYGVVVNLKRVMWRWWGKLDDGSWIQMGPIREALNDGPQGLPPC